MSNYPYSNGPNLTPFDKACLVGIIAASLLWVLFGLRTGALKTLICGIVSIFR